jgi:hypothetical protein
MSRSINRPLAEFSVCQPGFLFLLLLDEVLAAAYRKSASPTSKYGQRRPNAKS